MHLKNNALFTTLLGPDVKKFSSLLSTYNFFYETKQKNVYQSQRVILQFYYIYFLIIYCLLAQKMETEKWPKAAADSPLLNHKKNNCETVGTVTTN